MQELEKILKELEEFTFEAEVYNGDFEGADINNLLCLGDVRDVLRKHMNDGWIPVDERLPEVGEYVLGTNEYDEVMIYRYGWNSRHSRKMFFHECGAAAIITAWMPLPEPYRPKSKTPEERQEWKKRMLRNFMKKGEK